MRTRATLPVALLVALATACGDGSSPAPAPPAGGPPDGTPPPACQPATCASLGTACGPADDGCGTTLDCGGCPEGQSCGGGGTAGVCGAPTIPVQAPPGPEPGAIRWAAATPGILWVGVDDGGARWAASLGADGGGAAFRVDKRSRDGALLWSKAWAVRGEHTFDAALSPAGELVFSATARCAPSDPSCPGSIDVGGVRRRSAVVKLAPDGAIVWARSMEGRVVGADASGGAALGWIASGVGVPSTLSVAKLDARGEAVWSRRITSLLDLGLDRDGNVLATGCYQDDRFLVEGVPCGGGVVAAKLGPNGSPLWTAHVDGYWPLIAWTADGTEYAAARGGRPFVLTAISPDGALLWSQDFEGMANGRGEPVLVAADPTGPVAVAGYAYDLAPTAANHTFPVILGFDADGTPAFRREYRGLGQVQSMAYGADHEIVLAVPAGTAEVAGERVEGAMIVDLAP